MSVQAGLVTVEEFLRLPPPKEGRYELHHGEVVLMPPPKFGHTWVQQRIRKLLSRVLDTRGEVFNELPFRPAPEYQVWVADVAFVRFEQLARVRHDQYLTSPDLVIEVLSPGNTFDEISDKMSVCLANGCLSFWVVDPKRERVSVTEGDVSRHYGVESSATSELIGVSVPVREIFTPDSEPAL